MSSSLVYPAPQLGASLILSFRLQGKKTVILGSGHLAASRAFASLEANSSVIVIARGGADDACDELQWRAQQGQLDILDSGEQELLFIESYIQNSSGITLVCVTDTILGSNPNRRRSRTSAEHVYRLCRTHNLPVNTTDMPDLCDFNFTATHRFVGSISGKSSPLQVGVTTNEKGCRLAGRMKREIVARLPKEVGGAVEKIGKLREIVKASDAEDQDDINEDSGVTTPNRPVPARSPHETATESARRRMKWVAQVSEYWPLQKIAAMKDEEMKDVVLGNDGLLPVSPQTDDAPSMHSLDLSRPSASEGKIYLVGSGPGHPSLLTLAAHTLLTKQVHLVLSDKLIPAAILALIPENVEVRIARKFPGNAEGAQAETMKAAVEAARKGLTVVRLKQGDPIVYGRAGEEVLYFRSHGFEPLVVPGVSSALAGPMFAGIPVTQRGVAESFVVCTGVGRAGKDVKLPGYERSRTLLILMGVARLPQVLGVLMNESSVGRDGAQYAAQTPIALVERASMPDQRVLESTLGGMQVAVENMGEQRPPGMLVVGWSALALWGQGDVSVLEEGAEENDEQRIENWLGTGVGWRIREGLQSGWDVLS